LSDSRPVSVEALEDFCLAAMRRCGMREEDARVTAEVLVTTDTWGTFTHGTKSLRPYLKRMRAGGLDPLARPEVVREGAAWAVVDGHSGMAMVTSCFAMELAIAKAASAGVGMVTVRNSCHFGAAGYYASLALPHDMLGQAMCNDVPSMTVPGARGKVMGSNPLAYAAPAGQEKPILLDMATSAVAAGKVGVAQSEGRQIPDTWIVDDEGRPSTDPSLFPDSAALQPMAGHKGYGLALLIETLSGLLSGAGVSREILRWGLDDPSQPTGHGHAFLAMDIGAMVPLEVYRRRMDGLIREIKALPKAAGSERIYLPGEMEWERREQALAGGIFLPGDVRSSLRQLADDLHISGPEWD